MSEDLPDPVAPAEPRAADTGPSVPPSAAAERPARPHRPSSPGFWRHGLRLMLLPLTGLLLLLVIALAALWIWAGTEGSLAATLRWAGHWTPLTAQGVHGDLRHGGTVDQLTWAQDGTHVQIRGARLVWSPFTLLHHALYVRELSAAQVDIRVQHPPAAEKPAAGPPASLALPLTVRIDKLAVGQLRWTGSPSVTAHELVASYQYKSNQHSLTIDRVRIETDSGSAVLDARVTLQAHTPLTLDAVLNGTLKAASAPPLLTQTTLRGPLTDLHVTFDAQTTPAAQTAPATPASRKTVPMQAQIQAQLAPWAAQPLSEVHGRVQRLDLHTLLAAFWRQAPLTAITGRFDLAPVDTAGWRASADLTNTERSLPIERVQADLDWQHRTVTVRAVEASGAGSHLQASGHWQIDTRQGALNAALTAPGAALTVKGDLAPDTGAGHVQADITDAAHLLAWARALPGLREALARQLPGDKVQGQAQLTADWRGGWRNASTAAVQATLTVPSLTVQLPQSQEPIYASDHEPVKAPGRPNSDQPPAAAVPDTAPAVAAEPPSISRAAPIRVQDLHVSLNGTLAQARLALDGRARQGERQMALHLAASAGVVEHAAASWRVSLERLNLWAQDPRWGAWTLAADGPVALGVQPGGAFDVGAGALTLTPAAVPAETAAVQTAHDAAHESSPPSAATPWQPITLAWDASRWDGHLLSTSGHLTGLSVAWIARLTGVRPEDAGLTGDVAFAGAWRARVGPGQPLDLHASLTRTGGDLTLVANDPKTGLQTRVAAGLRAAGVVLDGTGSALHAQVQWNSEHAGQINADLRTQLTATPQGIGWTWSEAAPIAGQMTARLPQVAVWSVLAPPGWRLRGELAADAHIAGTRANPQLTGTLTAEHLALRSVVDGVQLGGGRLRARFDGAKLIVDEFSLRGRGSSGGTLTATGEAGWLDGRAHAQLDATLNHLRASLRADRQITTSGHLQAALDGRTITARGQIKIDEAAIILPDESAPTLGNDVFVHGGAPGASSQQNPPAAPAQDTPLHADVDIQIDLGDQFRLKGQGIDTRLTGTLTLAAQGPLMALPQLTGTIQTVDGRFHAYGQNLNIAHGSIRFTGALDNPVLDILALRPIYDANQKAGVQVQGTALLPRVRLYADPALPDSQTLAWLLLGHAAPATGAEAAMLQSAALALLGGRDSRGLAARLGLDELSLGNTTGANGTQSTSVTLGKRLSHRLYAAYQQSLSGTAGSLLIFYELSRRWQVRAQTGENAAVDLIFSLSFDGHGN